MLGRSLVPSSGASQITLATCSGAMPRGMRGAVPASGCSATMRGLLTGSTPCGNAWTGSGVAGTSDNGNGSLPGVSRLLPLVGLAAFGVVHASTVMLQVPPHTARAGGYEPARVRRLVRTDRVAPSGRASGVSSWR